MRITVDVPDRLWETYTGKSNLTVNDAVVAAITFSCNFGKVSSYIDSLEQHLKLLETQVEELKLLDTARYLQGLDRQEQLQNALDIQAALNEELADWKQIAIAAQAKIELLEKRSPQLPPIG